MTEKSFTLVPFPDPLAPSITIDGSLARVRNRLVIQYRVRGQVEKILYPAPASKPVRRTELWLATCFEFFLALPGQPHYWEFNLSPSGDWNAFRMDAYRRIGFREEEAISNLPVRFRIEPDCMAIGTALSLDGLIAPESTFQAGITSVIQTQDRHETYWALVHPQPQADFHSRESFILEMEGAGPL